jgi:hypothetical protein
MRILAACFVLAGACHAGEWKQLFNGKDLSGWEMVGPGRFVVEDGAMKTEGGMGLLFYKNRKFGNTTIRVVYKIGSPFANSGVFIRIPEPPRDPWYAVHNGYEVQIAGGFGGGPHGTGSIYTFTRTAAQPQKPAGEWNTMEIVLKGNVTVVRLNGEFVTEFPGEQPAPPRNRWYEPVRGPRPDAGYIGLQNHDANSVVYFREVSVLE